MVGSEQRLTGAESTIESQGSQLSLYGSNIGVLNAWITYYNNTLFPNVIFRNIDTETISSTQIAITGSSFSDISTLSVSVNLQSSNVLVFLTATDFWISSGGSSANADIALQLDSGTEVVVCRAYSDSTPNQNTYGMGASYIFQAVTPGVHVIKARGRVFSGATAYLGAGIAESTIQLCAIQF
jgi:hypothetical protein